ncbi:MAG: deoxyribonuclease IV [Oscillospiraceae bacterium]|nr:deoxyribonuclease IV [Oscillospiraceae bacterium]
MFYIGCHLSASKGFLHMGKEALSIGANTFQFFTRNPRGAKAKAIAPKDAAALRDLMAENHFGPVIAHAPYTMNACSADPHLRELAEQMMTDDLERMEHLPGNLYNFHPGSHVGQGVETGTEQIAAMLGRILQPDQHTTVLLETMAGKGSEVGRSFEELRSIIDQCPKGDLLGVCLDTCHISDGGYPVAEHLDDVLEEFDRVVGLKRLKAIHLNDSLNPLGSHKDRHAKIGEGSLGIEAFEKIINHPALRDLPFCLETPNELPGYAAEIALLKDLRKEKDI